MTIYSLVFGWLKLESFLQTMVKREINPNFEHKLDNIYKLSLTGVGLILLANSIIYLHYFEAFPKDPL